MDEDPPDPGGGHMPRSQTPPLFTPIVPAQTLEMALYMKQDFTPPILSRRWLSMKFRPNMLVNNRNNILTILESGLLFREDSIEVEQEAPSTDVVWRAAGGGKGGWLTRGEGLMALIGVSACVAIFPPRSLQRTTLINASAYASVPVLVRAAHRALCRGTLPALTVSMREYLALARRAAACLKEYRALHAHLGSITSAIESTHTMLCRQQSELAVLMSRASSALLGNAPWLRGDVAWDAVSRGNNDNLTKIHHAFLVVQSTLLKHIAMAHFIPSIHTQRLYKNYNERIYWLHHILIPHLTVEFQQNYDSLERMYRLLKNFGSNDTDINKKLGTAAIDNWMYSEVHSGIARTCLEMKLYLNKCNTLDIFLDSCALNNQDLDLDVLNKDIDEIVDGITNCLTTAMNSQIRLQKLRRKFNVPEGKVHEDINEAIDDGAGILKIEDKEPEVKDEVFYFVKTEDDEKIIQPAEDVSTGPGKKERDTTKVVLSELKRKLGKREDVMRERERQALVKTMPELRNNVPEFPRQIDLEDFMEKKGIIPKIKRNKRKRRLFKTYEIQRNHEKCNKYKLKIKKYEKDVDIKSPCYKANEKLNVKSRIISVSCANKSIIINLWYKNVQTIKKTIQYYNSDVSSDSVEEVRDKINLNNHRQDQNGEHSKNLNHSENDIFKFTKRDLELSPSSSESDFEYDKEKQLALLKDARRHRAVRRKNHPDKRASIDKDLDDSLKPIEYSFGTGMAMASMLQINSNARIPNMAQEEVFIGDGEVSDDSGNDEDA